MSSLSHDLLLIGYFNLHIDSSSFDVRQLTDILESFDLDQHVNFPSHIHANSLDLMIFSKECDVFSVSPSDMISDHFYVVAGLKISNKYSRTVQQTITYQKLKAINIAAFKPYIKISELIMYPKSSATAAGSTI